MRCPKCGSRDDKVIDSRQSRDSSSIRRRRQCLKCGYRSTSLLTLEQLVDEIVHDLETGGREVQSTAIGAKVLEKLRGIDEVAYLRYASIHRRFEDVDQFVDAIHALGKTAKPDSKQRELFPPDQVNHGRV